MNFLIKMKAEVKDNKGAVLSCDQSPLECALTLSRIERRGDDYIVVSCYEVVDSQLLMPLVLIANRIDMDDADSVGFYQICREQPEVLIFDGRFVPASGKIILTQAFGNVLLEGTVNGLEDIIQDAIPQCQAYTVNLASIQLKAEKIPWDYEIFPD